MKIKYIAIKWILIFSVMLSFTVQAKSYKPADDFVLLTITKTDMVSRYRKILDKQPDSKSLLLEASSSLLKIAKKENSYLLYGKIESILAKHKQNVINNLDLKIIYADVLQHRHAFDEAIILLQKINTAQANLMRASIYQNIGSYANASRECRKLIAKINLVVASTCLLHAQSYQGKLKQSYAALRKIFTRSTVLNKENKTWVISALAEMAQRTGKYKESLQYYKQANRLSPENNHIISEWVDVLFSLNQQKKILLLLENNHSDLRLNLRYQRSLISVNSFSDKKYLTSATMLNNAIAITELRKDSRHYDTRAEYYLWVSKDVARALYWAKQNWTIFKTPVAAKLLLAAARKANDHISMNVIYKWQKQNRIEDAGLIKVLTQIYLSAVSI